MHYTNTKTNTGNKKRHVNRIDGLKKSTISAPTTVIASMLLVLAGTPVHAVDNYQYSMLFTPSNYTLKAEAKGRVMIYDGLNSDTIDRAMDEQFNRIDNMMFVRIVHEQDNGEYYVEDDGCD